jgi:hypothetical protein
VELNEDIEQAEVDQVAREDSEQREERDMDQAEGEHMEQPGGGGLDHRALG